jgi:hypothetical protein
VGCSDAERGRLFRCSECRLPSSLDLVSDVSGGNSVVVCGASADELTWTETCLMHANLAKRQTLEGA